MGSNDKPLALTRYPDTFHSFGARSVPYTDTFDTTGLPLPAVGSPAIMNGGCQFDSSGSILIPAPALPQIDARFKGIRFELVYAFFDLAANVDVDLTPRVFQAVFDGPGSGAMPTAARSIQITDLGTGVVGRRTYMDAPFDLVRPGSGFPIYSMNLVDLDVTFGGVGGWFQFVALNVELI
jgi:hypothetical protein